jgi:oxygen-independent coproporphyrinogen-3 oxidase
VGAPDKTLVLPPLSLYVHFPWCETKCPYCDFNSHALRDVLPEEDYCHVLLHDLKAISHYAQGRQLASVFFGGGTPSLFSASVIAQVLEHADKQIGLQENVEITLEANPGSADVTRFSDYHSAGVTRLSLGVQSFSDTQLLALGRIHNSLQALQAVDMATDAGFAHVNIDLMHGLPEQNVDLAAQDIDTAITLEPSHLSLYQLTLEPNTQFAAQPPALPDETTCWQIRNLIEETAISAGYEQYEVSAFARPGSHCSHNLNYWSFGDYLGIGAGAHGKVTSPNGIGRYAHEKHPRRYMAMVEASQSGKNLKSASAEEIAFEFLLNALRLKNGFRLIDFSQRTGLSAECILDTVKNAENRGLLNISNNRVRATDLGYRFLDDVIALFLPETD